MPVHIVSHALDELRIAPQIALIHIPVQKRGAIGTVAARIQIVRQHLHNAGAGQRLHGAATGNPCQHHAQDQQSHGLKLICSCQKATTSGQNLCPAAKVLRSENMGY